MTEVSGIFTDGDYIVFQNDPLRTRVPCVPRAFEMSQLQPTWVDDEKWEFIVNAHTLPIHTTQDLITNAYMFLSFYEDLRGIYDGKRHTIATSYFAIIWSEHDNAIWRNIIATALRTNIEVDYPYCNRPSICILSKSWLDFYEFDFDPPAYHPSLIFDPVGDWQLEHGQWSLRELDDSE